MAAVAAAVAAAQAERHFMLVYQFTHADFYDAFLAPRYQQTLAQHAARTSDSKFSPHERVLRVVVEFTLGAAPNDRLPAAAFPAPADLVGADRARALDLARACVIAPWERKAGPQDGPDSTLFSEDILPVDAASGAALLELVPWRSQAFAPGRDEPPMLAHMARADFAAGIVACDHEHLLFRSAPAGAANGGGGPLVPDLRHLPDPRATQTVPYAPGAVPLLALRIGGAAAVPPAAAAKCQNLLPPKSGLRFADGWPQGSTANDASDYVFRMRTAAAIYDPATWADAAATIDEFNEHRGDGTVKVSFFNNNKPEREGGSVVPFLSAMLRQVPYVWLGRDAADASVGILESSTTRLDKDGPLEQVVVDQAYHRAGGLVRWVRPKPGVGAAVGAKALQEHCASLSTRVQFANTYAWDRDLTVALPTITEPAVVPPSLRQMYGRVGAFDFAPDAYVEFGPLARDAADANHQALPFPVSRRQAAAAGGAAAAAAVSDDEMVPEASDWEKMEDPEWLKCQAAVEARNASRAQRRELAAAGGLPCFNYLGANGVAPALNNGGTQLCHVISIDNSVAKVLEDAIACSINADGDIELSQFYVMQAAAPGVPRDPAAVLAEVAADIGAGRQPVSMQLGEGTFFAGPRKDELRARGFEDGDDNRAKTGRVALRIDCFFHHDDMPAWLVEKRRQQGQQQQQQQEGAAAAAAAAAAPAAAGAVAPAKFWLPRRYRVSVERRVVLHHRLDEKHGSRDQIAHSDPVVLQRTLATLRALENLSDALRLGGGVASVGHLAGFRFVREAGAQAGAQAALAQRAPQEGDIIELRPSLDDRYAVDVPGAKACPGAKISLYRVNGTPAQRFMVTRAGANNNNSVSLVSLCVGDDGEDVALTWDGAAAETRITLQKLGDANQDFRFVVAGGGAFTVLCGDNGTRALSAPPPFMDRTHLLCTSGNNNGQPAMPWSVVVVAAAGSDLARTHSAMRDRVRRLAPDRFMPNKVVVYTSGTQAVVVQRIHADKNATLNSECKLDWKSVAQGQVQLAESESDEDGGDGEDRLVDLEQLRHRAGRAADAALQLFLFGARGSPFYGTLAALVQKTAHHAAVDAAALAWLSRAGLPDEARVLLCGGPLRNGVVVWRTMRAAHDDQRAGAATRVPPFTPFSFLWAPTSGLEDAGRWERVVSTAPWNLPPQASREGFVVEMRSAPSDAATGAVARDPVTGCVNIATADGTPIRFAAGATSGLRKATHAAVQAVVVALLSKDTAVDRARSQQIRDEVRDVAQLACATTKSRVDPHSSMLMYLATHKRIARTETTATVVGISGAGQQRVLTLRHRHILGELIVSAAGFKTTELLDEVQLVLERDASDARFGELEVITDFNNTRVMANEPGAPNVATWLRANMFTPSDIGAAIVSPLPPRPQQPVGMVSVLMIRSYGFSPPMVLRFKCFARASPCATLAAYDHTRGVMLDDWQRMLWHWSKID